MDLNNIMELKLSYTILKEVNGSTVSLNKEKDIVRIEWDGVVDIEEAKTILTIGADQIEKGTAKNLLLNRKNLEEFSTAARLWIKEDLLKGRAKKLVKQVHKVAMVNASSTMGSVFANFISTAIKLVYPNLSMSKFQSEDEALEWLLKEK